MEIQQVAGTLRGNGENASAPPRGVTAGGAFRRGGDVRPLSAAFPLPPRKLVQLKSEAGEEEKTSQKFRRSAACQGTPGADGGDRARVVATMADNSFPER